MAQYLNLKPVDFDNLSAKSQAAIKWEGRLLSPKWDGCMVLVGFKEGKPDFIMSRDGKPVLSMGHMYTSLLICFPFIEKMVGNICFIGEAWVPGMAFKDISGMFRRHSPQTALYMAVFDAVSYVAGPDGPRLWSDHAYGLRVAKLKALQVGPAISVILARPIVCEGEAHAVAYAKNLKALGGYDGCIAADPEATYRAGSGSNGEFLKVKPLQSFTLEVTGVAASTGEKTGRVTAALHVRFKDGVCGVGTGFSNEQAAQWVASPASIIGRMIEVECMGVYGGPLGMMREPRFVGFRTDVTKADY